jgi:uncharacterized protein
MYHHPDQSWRQQPLFMSPDTIRAFVARLNEHARTFPVRPRFLVVAHGGEPLLCPDLDSFFDTIRTTTVDADVMFTVQTNGILLNAETATVLRRHGVRIGVSIDGNQMTHDRLRVLHDGRGSYDAVMRGLEAARRDVPDLLDSVLQVIDTSMAPADVVPTLESYGVARADLLFPDLNHDTFPRSALRAGELGEWLCNVFDHWVSRQETVNIRIFSTLIHLLLGGRSGTDQLGARSDGALMIETDGTYHVYDALKTAFIGAGTTTMSVLLNAIQEAEELPFSRAFRDKASGASMQCLNCSLFQVCGGGSPIHRFGAAKGFDQPSVFCEDLTRLITHIRNYLLSVRPDLGETIWGQPLSGM